MRLLYTESLVSKWPVVELVSGSGLSQVTGQKSSYDDKPELNRVHRRVRW